MKPASRQELIDFCLRNKYFNWYCSIVDRAKTRNWSKRKTKEYFERHHIIPKSICPEKTNDKSNIVTLTAKEHFICHMLLTKCMISAENTTKCILLLLNCYMETINLTQIIHGHIILYRKITLKPHHREIKIGGINLLKKKDLL